MSRIPYLDRLGDEFERAVAESARRKWHAAAVLLVAFVTVLLAGGSVWLLRGGRGPDATQSSTTTPDEPVSIDAVAIPASWARVPETGELSVEGYATFGSVVATDVGFAAVGNAHSQNGADRTIGLVLESDDGIMWRTVMQVDGVILNGIVYGRDGLLAVGMREFRPVVVDAKGTVVDLPVLENRGERVVTARAVAATDNGYVAVGDELDLADEQRQRGAVWWSDDGVTWVAVDSPALGWYREAAINDVIADSGIVLAVGLVSSESGTSMPTAWVSGDGLTWERYELPADESGYTIASGVAAGYGRYVAVGSKPSSAGTTGTAWVSEDGHSWTQLTDDALSGADGAATRISSIAAVGDGFVAVGHSQEQPATRHVNWTADSAAGSWSRLDLTDDSPDMSTSAFGVAANRDRVVVTGATFGLGYSEASGAVWVGPAPDSLKASVPITTTPKRDTDDSGATLAIDPTQAVGATNVRVVGRLPADHAMDDVVVQLTSGETRIELCRAVTQGRNYMCHATIADLVPQPEPGIYEVRTVGVQSPSEPASIEVMPEGTPIIRLTGIYTPNYVSSVGSVTVQNKGGQDIDLRDGQSSTKVETNRASTSPPAL